MGKYGRSPLWEASAILWHILLFSRVLLRFFQQCFSGLAMEYGMDLHGMAQLAGFQDGGEKRGMRTICQENV